MSVKKVANLATFLLSTPGTKTPSLPPDATGNDFHHLDSTFGQTSTNSTLRQQKSRVSLRPKTQLLAQPPGKRITLTYTDIFGHPKNIPYGGLKKLTHEEIFGNVTNSSHPRNTTTKRPNESSRQSAASHPKDDDDHVTMTSKRSRQKNKRPEISEPSNLQFGDPFIKTPQIPFNVTLVPRNEINRLPPLKELDDNYDDTYEKLTFDQEPIPDVTKTVDKKPQVTKTGMLQSIQGAWKTRRRVPSGTKFKRGPEIPWIERCNLKQIQSN